MVGSPENVGPMGLNEEGVSVMKRTEIKNIASQKKRGGIEEIEVSGKGRGKGSGKGWGGKGESYHPPTRTHGSGPQMLRAGLIGVRSCAFSHEGSAAMSSYPVVAAR